MRGTWKRKVLAVALALGIASGSTALATGIPVIDIVQEIQQIINYAAIYAGYVEQAVDTIYTYYQWYLMFVEGQWYPLLASVLMEAERIWPDSAAGQFLGEIEDLRSLSLGTAASYGRTHDKVMEIYGGSEPVGMKRRLPLETTEAVVSRALMEGGKYRAVRDVQKEKVKQIVRKAETEGRDRILQTQVVMAGQIYEEILNGNMLAATTNEILASQLALERERRYVQSKSTEAVTEGLKLFIGSGGGSGPEVIKP